MAGKKGRSGPVGNLNATKRPWRSFWKRRALRAEDRHLLPMIESYGAGLLSDKPDASEAERRCIELAQIARGASMLILAEAGRSGFITKADGTWDLAPGGKELARFLSIERQALMTLGLQRRAKAPIMLSDYIEAKRKNDQEPQQP
ncbi:MAG: hypothetical protein KF751_06265 [Nitrospira sp.]|nr:hypothetical protein [Nitrospira sp.]